MLTLHGSHGVKSGQNTFRVHAHITADHNSPFLSVFGGPGGLSVTDPGKRKKHSVNQRLDSNSQ